MWFGENADDLAPATLLPMESDLERKICVPEGLGAYDIEIDRVAVVSRVKLKLRQNNTPGKSAKTVKPPL